ncbi:hypothetical protein BGY98DRAFT_980220 [Russula aff. rugulosa BPL654]|nr:hypothetical protein BGY98DRAFT_980220 [Russula aff. rugulosa BPL654]
MSLRLKKFMIPSTPSIPCAIISPSISGRCQGLTISFDAGHTFGGTIWRIRSPAIRTIVYTVNMNHM